MTTAMPRGIKTAIRKIRSKILSLPPGSSKILRRHGKLGRQAVVRRNGVEIPDAGARNLSWGSAFRDQRGQIRTWG
jgi:hypothetical protein